MPNQPTDQSRTRHGSSSTTGGHGNGARLGGPGWRYPSARLLVATLSGGQDGGAWHRSAASTVAVREAGP
jgi:hypothetical protein